MEEFRRIKVLIITLNKEVKLIVSVGHMSVGRRVYIIFTHRKHKNR